LVAHHETPAQVRRAGCKRIAAYLRNRGVKGASGLAQNALDAAKAQSAALPAEDVAASIVAELAKEVLELKGHVRALNKEIRRRFSPVRRHGSSLACPDWGPYWASSSSWPWATSGPLRTPTASLLTPGWRLPPEIPAMEWATIEGCVAGTRFLNESIYQSAFASLRTRPESRAFYDRKRAEGKRHTQALIALARRRVNVLWAMLRDRTTFTAPSAA